MAREVGRSIHQEGGPWRSVCQPGGGRVQGPGARQGAGHQGHREQGGPGEASLGAEALRAAGPPAGGEVEPRRAVLACLLCSQRQDQALAVQAQGLLGGGGGEGVEAGSGLAQAAREGAGSG